MLGLTNFKSSFKKNTLSFLDKTFEQLNVDLMNSSRNVFRLENPRAKSIVLLSFFIIIVNKMEDTKTNCELILRPFR